MALFLEGSGENMLQYYDKIEFDNVLGCEVAKQNDTHERREPSDLRGCNTVVSNIAMNIAPKQLIPVDTFLFVFRKLLSNSHKSLQHIFCPRGTKRLSKMRNQLLQFQLEARGRLPP